MCVQIGSSAAVPETGEIREADGLDVDVPLSVEPSSSVPQFDGTDLTQKQGVSQHCAVYCCMCLTDKLTECACKQCCQYDNITFCVHY